MQIPATSSAAQAASIVAQAASKDVSADSKATNASAQPLSSATVEKSGSANPDRDAQGQGDGLPNDATKSNRDEIDIDALSDTAISTDLPNLPAEPPSQLDIIG